MSFLSRFERFGVVTSTNDVVASWLAGGVPEVALAIADHQSAGRGRERRTWIAPTGAALLLSLGFRPGNMPVGLGWRLGAIAALAMAEAAEAVSGLADGTIGLKWPNDLVAEAGGGRLRKVAGVLGESTAEGDALRTAVVGIGLNCDWAAADFPSSLAGTMTSLREISRRRVDREAILIDFLEGLDRRYRALRRGEFDAASWLGRQRTTGRELTLETGSRTLYGRGMGIDPQSGALLLETDHGAVAIAAGDVVSCRLADAVTV